MMRPYRTRIGKALSYLFGMRYRELLEEDIRLNGKPALAYLYLDNARVLQGVSAMCRRRGIPMLRDCVEWYSPCEFRLGRLSRAYLHLDVCNRLLTKPPMKVIAISRYLARYFADKGMDVCRIPATMDVSAMPWASERAPGPIRLAYAGNPGRKDNLAAAVQALAMLSAEERKQFELHLVGINGEQLAAICGGDPVARLGDTLHAYGRQSRERTLEILRGCDFCILLRPAGERFAQAGFPSKSAEAMASGVAMLCNLTSDLGDYLIDGENAVLAASDRAEDVRDALLRAAALTDTEIGSIRENARRTAQTHFDFRNYIDTVRELLGDGDGNGENRGEEP